MKIWMRADNSYANSWSKGDLSVVVGRVGKEIQILYMDLSGLDDEEDS